LGTATKLTQAVEPAMLQHVLGARLVQTAFQSLSQLFMKRMSTAVVRERRVARTPLRRVDGRILRFGG
jgi:hypothetical protein